MTDFRLIKNCEFCDVRNYAGIIKCYFFKVNLNLHDQKPFIYYCKNSMKSDKNHGNSGT